MIIEVADHDAKDIQEVIRQIECLGLIKFFVPRKGFLEQRTMGRILNS